MGEVVRGHALQHGPGGLAGGDAFRNGYEAGQRHDGELGIGAENVRPGDAVADLEAEAGGAGLGGTEGGDGSGSLLAGDEGQLDGIAALALVDVDEVDAAGFDAHQRLAGARFGRGEIAERHDFGSAGMGNLDGSHGASMLQPAGGGEANGEAVGGPAPTVRLATLSATILFACNPII